MWIKDTKGRFHNTAHFRSITFVDAITRDNGRDVVTHRELVAYKVDGNRCTLADRLTAEQEKQLTGYLTEFLKAECDLGEFTAGN